MHPGEVFAGDFPRLPVNQPYSYDGASESRWREAGFLVHTGVSSAEVPGVPDSQELCAFAHSTHFTQELLRLNVCP